LLGLIPATATGPLFLDPVSAGLDEGLELVQQAPACLVRDELQRVLGSRPLPPCPRLLATGDRQTWRDLDRALRLTHDHLLSDARPRIWSGLRAELA
jgi:hypothetical protein